MGELQTAVEGLYGSIFRLDPRLLHDNYIEQMKRAGDDCPTYVSTVEEDGFDTWEDDCTTPAGDHFRGWAKSADAEPIVAGSATFEEDRYLAGAMHLTTADGATFEIGGESSYVVFYRAVERTIVSDRVGSFRWDGPGSEGTWLVAGGDYNLYVRATAITTTSARMVFFQGTVTVPGAPIEWVNFKNLTMATDVLAADCAAEPEGTLQVRDAAGIWYEIEFQGGDAPAGDSGGDTGGLVGCDGCGEVWWEGQHIGDVCPDTAPLSDWEDTPW